MWEELPQIVKLFAALIFVVSLMGGLAFILKKLGLDKVGLGNAPIVSATKKRLKIIEALPLDQRRRLVLVQRDDVQHLVILSANSETIVETNIKPKKSS